MRTLTPDELNALVDAFKEWTQRQAYLPSSQLDQIDVFFSTNTSKAMKLIGGACFHKSREALHNALKH
ncbi:hypothetical protein V6233_09605 [Vibrio antiquarius]